MLIARANLTGEGGDRCVSCDRRRDVGVMMTSSLELPDSTDLTVNLRARRLNDCLSD